MLNFTFHSHYHTSIFIKTITHINVLPLYNDSKVE